MFQKFQFPCATQASWADRAGQVGDQPWGQGCQQTTRVSPTFFVGNSFKTPYFAIATRWRGRSKICGFTSFFSVCWTCGCACFFGVKFYVFACGLMLLSIWISSLLLRCGYCRSTCKGTAIHLVTTSESNVFAVKIWDYWRLRGPARKWITWRSNWRCSAERSFHWLLFWMHHVLTIPGWLFFWFSWHQVFFSNKIWCGSMYCFICNYLESKRFWYTNWILTHGVSNVGPRKLEEKLGSKLDGEELLPVVKGPASSFDELIELLSSKMVIKMGSLSKRDKRWGYIYIYTQ